MIITKEKFDALRWIGSQMSNVCYNLSQHENHILKDHEREMMATLFREWDEAIRAVKPTAKARSRG